MKAIKAIIVVGLAMLTVCGCRKGSGSHEQASVPLSASQKYGILDASVGAPEFIVLEKTHPFWKGWVVPLLLTNTSANSEVLELKPAQINGTSTSAKLTLGPVKISADPLAALMTRMQSSSGGVNMMLKPPTASGTNKSSVPTVVFSRCKTTDDMRTNNWTYRLSDDQAGTWIIEVKAGETAVIPVPLGGEKEAIPSSLCITGTRPFLLAAPVK